MTALLVSAAAWGGVADGGVPDDRVAESSVAESSVAESSVADGSVPDGSVPDDGVADDGVAESSVPDGGEADGGVPDAGEAPRMSAQPDRLEQAPDLQGLLDLLEMPIDVATASSTKESLRTSPAGVELITASDIKRWGYRTLGEALSHVAGFYLVDDHILPNLAVRGVSGGLGAESGVVKLLIDGRVAIFRSTSGAWLGTEAIPITSVERIEIIRGPASAMYGADAFLGVINVVTRSQSAEGNAELRLIGGRTVHSYSGLYDATVILENDKWTTLIGLVREEGNRSGLRLPASSPAPVVPDYNRGQASVQGLERRSSSAIGKVEYAAREPSAKLTGARLTARYAELRRGGDFSSWSQLSQGLDSHGRENGTIVSLEQLSISLDSKWRLAPELAANVAASYFQGNSKGDERIEAYSDLFYFKRNLSFSGLEAKAEVLWRSDRDFGLMVGAEVTRDHEDISNPSRVLKLDGTSLVGEREPAHELTNLGALAQSHLWLREGKLRLTGGLRLDEHLVYGPQLTGRFALVNSWSDELVTRFLYGSAFKAPAPQLLYARPLQAGGLIGNEALRPQYVHTVELNGSYQFLKYFNVVSGVAYSLLIDKAEFVPQGTNQTANNIARVQTVSWETRVDALYRNVFRGYAGLDLQRTFRELGEGGYLVQLVGDSGGEAPAWIARFGLSGRLELPGRFTVQLNAEGRWVDRRRASDSNVLEQGRPYYLDPYFDLGASIGIVDFFVLPLRETSISLRAADLLGQSSADPGYAGVDYPRVGREVFLELRQQL